MYLWVGQRDSVFMEVDLRWGSQELRAKPQDEDRGDEESQVWSQIAHNVPGINRAESENAIYIYTYVSFNRTYSPLWCNLVYFSNQSLLANLWMSNKLSRKQ